MSILSIKDIHTYPFKMGLPRPIFVLFSVFSHTNFTVKTVGVSGIRTRIVGVEGEYANHLTTTTALDIPNLNTILFVPM